jgi:hypothetical protein
MQTLQSRPGGVYRSERIQTLDVPGDFAGDDYGDLSMAKSFAVIAEEISLGSLCVIQALTMLAAAVSVILMSRADRWLEFTAVGAAAAFLAVATSVGGYLISIKTSSGGKGS